MFDWLFKKRRELQDAADFEKVWRYYIALRRSGKPLEPRGERFEFECSKRWQDLRGTGDPYVRRCEECQRDVHFAPDEAAFQKHAAAGHCVAILDEQVEERFEELPGFFGRRLPLKKGSRCLVLMNRYQAIESGVDKASPYRLTMGQPPPPQLANMPDFVRDLVESTELPPIPERFLAMGPFAHQAERLRNPRTPQERFEALLLYGSLAGWEPSEPAES